MIKNNTFNVYDRMDRETLVTMAMAFETDFVAASLVEARENIKTRLAIIYALLKYKFKGK